MSWFMLHATNSSGAPKQLWSFVRQRGFRGRWPCQSKNECLLQGALSTLLVLANALRENENVCARGCSHTRFEMTNHEETTVNQASRSRIQLIHYSISVTLPRIS